MIITENVNVKESINFLRSLRYIISESYKKKVIETLF